MYTKTERIEKIMRGESKATVLTQNEVAYLFAHGIDDKRSGTGNLHSQSDEGVLWHYRTIEAIRQKDGTVLKNRECYSAGFASCPTVPKAKHWLDLSTLLSFINTEQIRRMSILDQDKQGNTLMIVDMRYFINGRDENARYIAELDACLCATTLKEAYESMKPEAVKRAERHELSVKRQGELFFIETSDAYESIFGEFDPQSLKSITRAPEKRYKCRKCGRKNVSSYNHHYVSEHFSENPCKGDMSDVEEYEGYTIERPSIQIDHLEFRQHTATRTAKLNGYTIVQGVILHATGDHRRLKLEKWHVVVKNAVVRSVSVGGGVD